MPSTPITGPDANVTQLHNVSPPAAPSPLFKSPEHLGPDANTAASGAYMHAHIHTLSKHAHAQAPTRKCTLYKITWLTR